MNQLRTASCYYSALAAGLFSMSLAQSSASFAKDKEFKVDVDHSSVGFTVTHLMISHVKGDFKKYDGDFTTDEKGKKILKANATIEVASVNTGSDKRDGHLKSPDFFDAAKFPKITFKSTKWEDTGDGKGKLTGDFTLHGVTKSVTLDTTVLGSATMMGKEHFGFSATGSILRSDFGLKWNMPLANNGVAVGDKVDLSLEVEGVTK